MQMLWFFHMDEQISWDYIPSYADADMENASWETDDRSRQDVYKSWNEASRVWTCATWETDMVILIEFVSSHRLSTDYNRYGLLSFFALLLVFLLSCIAFHVPKDTSQNLISRSSFHIHHLLNFEVFFSLNVVMNLCFCMLLISFLLGMGWCSWVKHY